MYASPFGSPIDGSVRINGRELEAFAQPGSYLSLTREWRDGDKIEISLPMQLQSEPLLGDSTLRATLYGPLVLAANLGPGPTDGPLKFSHGRGTAPSDAELGPAAPPPVAPAGDVSTWLEVASPKDLTFKSVGAKDALAVKPLYRVADEKYAVYWGTETKV